MDNPNGNSGIGRVKGPFDKIAAKKIFEPAVAVVVNYLDNSNALWRSGCRERRINLGTRLNRHSHAPNANPGRYLPVRSRCLHPGQQQGRR